MDASAQLVMNHKESGNIKVSNNKPEEAINDYSMALKLAESTLRQRKYQPSLIDLMSLIHSNRAQCHIQLKQYQNGITDCNQSVALTTANKNTNHSKLWKSYYRRAICYESLNQLDNALDDLKNANILWSKHNSKSSTKSKHKHNGKNHKTNPIKSAVNRIKQKLKQQPSNQNTFLNNNVFTKQHGIALINNGYVVIDNFFKTCIANKLSFELTSMLKLQNSSYLTPNTTFFKNKQNKITPFNKPHIWEIDLHSIFTTNKLQKIDQNKQSFPHFYHLFSSNVLGDVIESKLLQIDDRWTLSKGNGKYAIKLQWNEGKNGCFPLHIDNPGNNKRRITMVFYLNKGWKQGDGGEIVLLPFMDKQIIIPPVFNRCVLFLSETMLHRVLPSHKARYCFSVWIDKATNAVDIDELLVDDDHDDDDEKSSRVMKLGSIEIEKEMEWLKKPSVECTLSRWVYEEEYVDSLRECMIDYEESDVYKELYAMHRAHIDGLKKANEETGLIEIVDWLQKNKPKKDECIRWDSM